MTIYEKIRFLREEQGLSQQDLADKLGYKSRSAINKIELGLRDISHSKVIAFANALGVSPAYLLGWSDDKEGNTNSDNNVFSIKNISPLPQTNKKPRLGVIACGEPILAEENIDDYDEVPEDIKCDFTLLCKGDSMINARINDGDIVYIRQQDEVNNGEIAACLVDGEFETEATLKRYFRYDDKIVLQAENPKYPPFVYVNEEMNKVRIIGKAVGFTSVL